MQRFSSLLAIAVVLLSWSGTAASVLLYDNAANVDTFRESTGALHYDDIRFDVSPGPISRIDWTGVYWPVQPEPLLPDNFSIYVYHQIYESLPDIRRTPLYSFNAGQVDRVDTGIDVFGYDLYSYSTLLPEFTLPESTTFWLSIQNGPGTPLWYWGAEYQAGNSWRRFVDGGWFQAGHVADFRLYNSEPSPVPTVSSGALLWVGVIALSMSRRVRRHGSRMSTSCTNPPLVEKGSE